MTKRQYWTRRFICWLIDHEWRRTERTAEGYMKNCRFCDFTRPVELVKR